MRWNKNNDIKDQALKKYEQANRELVKTGERLIETTQTLYWQRIEALKAIEAAESKLIKRHDFDIDNIRMIADAKAKIRPFAEVIQNVNEDTGSIDDASSDVATFDPISKIAFSTTFSTSATGPDISAISGTTTIERSALRWLFGLSHGTLAVGTAIIALAVPPAWSWGVIAAGSYVLSKKKKYAMIAQQANEAANQIEDLINKVTESINEINLCRNEIAAGIGALNSLMKGIPIDNGQVKYNDDEIVKTIESLCTNINKKFIICQQ